MGQETCTSTLEYSTCSHLRPKARCPRLYLQFHLPLPSSLLSSPCPPALQLLYLDSPSLPSPFRLMTGRSGLLSFPPGYVPKKLPPLMLWPLLQPATTCGDVPRSALGPKQAFSSLVPHLSEIRLHVPSTKIWQVLLSSL